MWIISIWRGQQGAGSRKRKRAGGGCGSWKGIEEEKLMEPSRRCGSGEDSGIGKRRSGFTLVVGSDLEEET